MGYAIVYNERVYLVIIFLIILTIIIIIYNLTTLGQLTGAKDVAAVDSSSALVRARQHCIARH